MSPLMKNYSSPKKITDCGMCELFLASELSTNRIVVIKKLTFSSAERKFLLKRFQNETRNVSSLSHKNIISIYDSWIDGDNFYIAMEHIDGCDFNTIISDSLYDRTVGLMIATKTLQALYFSHVNNAIHCNIKPSNILIDRTGRIVLTDFGLSRMIDNEDRYNYLAPPIFMPPEQLYLVSGQIELDNEQLIETSSIYYNSNLPPEEIIPLTLTDKQWDIWSAGVLLYRVCTGYYPFFEQNLSELLKSISFADPINIIDLAPDLPIPIANVIMQCLQKESYLRPQSLDPIINTLQEYFDSLGILNIDEIVSAYMREKSNLLPVLQESETQPFDNANATYQTSTQQQESDYVFNNFIEQFTIQDETISFEDELSTLNDKSSTLNDKSSTLNDKSSILNDKSSILNDKSSNLNDKSSVLNDKASALNDKASALNDKASALNDKAYTLNDKAYTSQYELLTSQCELLTSQYEQAELLSPHNELLTPKDKLLTPKNRYSILNAELLTLQDEPVNLNEEPVTLNEEPVNLNQEPVTLNQEPVTLNQEPVTLNEEPVTLDEKPVNLNEDFLNLNDEFLNLKNESSNPKDESVTLNEESLNFNEESPNLSEEPVNLSEEFLTLNEEHVTLNEEHVTLNEEHVTLNEEPVTIKEILLTSQDELLTIKDDVLPLQDESKWEFNECKTLRYVPQQHTTMHQNKMMHKNNKFSQRIVTEWISLFIEMLKDILIDILSLTKLFSIYRKQLTQAGITLITIIFFVVFGIFITKSITNKRDRIAHSFSSDIKNISDSHKKSEAQVSQKVTSSEKKSEVIPDLNTKSEIIQTPGINNASNLIVQKSADVAKPEKSIASKNSSRRASQLSLANEKSPKPKEKQYEPVEITESVVTFTTKRGTIKITVDDPPDAQVYIDGTLLTQSDIENGRKLTPGNYTITANAAGYKSYTRSVVVESDKTLILSLVLKPDVKGNGQLHIYSYPWANLYIDGVLIGTTPTPTPISLPEGVHDMVLKRDGYQQYNEKVTVRTGDVVRLKVELMK